MMKALAAALLWALFLSIDALALQLCQSNDICIFFHHEAVSGFSHPDGSRALATIPVVDLCDGGWEAPEGSQLLGRVVLGRVSRRSCSVTAVALQLQQQGVAGLVLFSSAGSEAPSPELSSVEVELSVPAVAVSQEVGMQILYLLKAADGHLSIDFSKAEYSAHRREKGTVPIGLPFLTSLFKYMSQVMQTSENNMRLLMARYRRAMASEWKHRAVKRPGQETSTVLSEADVQAMEDFALQTASYFIVLVVAAMIGAAGASLLTSASKRFRQAAIAQLPTMIYTAQRSDDSDSDGEGSGQMGNITNMINNLGTSLSDGLQSASLGVNGLISGLSFNKEDLARQLNAVIEAAADRKNESATEFMAYLSTRAPQLWLDLQEMIKGSTHMIESNISFYMGSGETSSTRKSSGVTKKRRSARGLPDPESSDWSLQRLLKTVGSLASEYTQFEQGTDRSVVSRPRRSSRQGSRRPEGGGTSPASEDSDGIASAANNSFSTALASLQSYLYSLRQSGGAFPLADDAGASIDNAVRSDGGDAAPDSNASRAVASRIGSLGPTTRSKRRDSLSSPDKYGVDSEFSSSNRRPKKNSSGRTRGMSDSCPICLSMFVEGDVLTKLPCEHLFHKKCVVPWLTNSAPYCPMCNQFGKSVSLASTVYSIATADTFSSHRIASHRSGTELIQREFDLSPRG